MRLRGDSGTARYEHFSDEALVALMSRNDTGALDAFYARVGHLAYGLALRIVGDEQIAQDIVCAAFVQLWRRAPAYSGGGARAQLLATIHRSACDTTRQARRTRVGPEADLSPWIALERESAEHVLSHLTLDERAAIELAYYGGRNRSEISDELTMSFETVTGLVTSGMNTLRSRNAANASVSEEAPLDAGDTTPAPG